MIDITSWTGFIAQVGFPIATTTYLLFERNKTTKENTKATQELVVAVKLLHAKLKK